VLNAGISGNTTVDLLGRLDLLPGLGGATVVLGPRCLAPVRELNRRLRGAVPAADVLDLPPLLADGAGLRRSMGVDGLHLGPDGYRLWFERLRPMV
jgi:lysophospholipase L1-like esterase